MAADALVVDASAVAALLFGEPSGPAIADRLGSHALLAPTLLRYELASVCRKKVLRHPNKERELTQALALVPSLGIQEVQPIPGPLVDIALQTGLTTYDAAYLWLAREAEAELVTLDARLNDVRLGRT
jgi:predicted nucleic acid-binding protein